LPLGDLGLSAQQSVRAWHGLDIGPLDNGARNFVQILREFEQPDEPRIAIWFAPFDPFARLLPPMRALDHELVYFPLDDYAAMAELGLYRNSIRAEEFLASQVDTIITLSHPV